MLILINEVVSKCTLIHHWIFHMCIVIWFGWHRILLNAVYCLIQNTMPPQVICCAIYSTFYCMLLDMKSNTTVPFTVIWSAWSTRAHRSAAKASRLMPCHLYGTVSSRSSRDVIVVASSGATSYFTTICKSALRGIEYWCDSHSVSVPSLCQAERHGAAGMVEGCQVVPSYRGHSSPVRPEFWRWRLLWRRGDDRRGGGSTSLPVRKRQK